MLKLNWEGDNMPQENRGHAKSPTGAARPAGGAGVNEAPAQQQKQLGRPRKLEGQMIGKPVEVWCNTNPCKARKCLSKRERSRRSCPVHLTKRQATAPSEQKSQTQRHSDARSPNTPRDMSLTYYVSQKTWKDMEAAGTPRDALTRMERYGIN